MHTCALWAYCRFHVFMFPWRLIVVVGCLLFVRSWSAGGLCDVMLGIEHFFLGGEAVWRRVGVMGCVWWVSPKPLGQACWRCLVVSLLFWLSVSPGDFCLGWGMSCVRHVCSFGRRVVCGLWSPGFCGRLLVGLGG